MSKKKIKKREIIGGMDHYRQVRISLSNSDIRTLERTGKLEERMWVTWEETEGRDCDIVIYLCENSPPSEGEVKPLVDNQYQMYIDKRSLQLIKDGRFAGADAHPDQRGFYRQIMITKEGVL